MSDLLRRLAPLLASLAASPLAASAQTPAPAVEVRIVADAATRIADPKLPGGAPQLAFHLEPAGTTVQARAELLRDGDVLDELWSGTLIGGAAATGVSWDGRDAQGERCPTGSYTVRVSALGATPLVLPLDVVRLGVTRIDAQDSPAGDDELRMVYFRKGGTYAYYATPAIHEYLNVAPSGETSDLDHDDGEPRAVVPVHTATDSPVLDGGGDYHTATYNYPLAYVMGITPRVELTFGAEGTTAGGEPMPAGYPVDGFDLRAVVTTGATVAETAPIAAGGIALVDLEPLPAEVRRTEIDVEVRWQYSPAGAGEWQDVPGELAVPLRVYTTLGQPFWKEGAVGTRYAGPWVEVADYVSHWKETLQMPAHDVATLTDVFVQGFFGQNGGLPEPIEGVIYDAYPLGGDGGNTHYFGWSGWRMDLSSLLNGHAKGVFVNCTDNMGATTTMLSMMGVPNVRPMQLGGMNLKAIWGIGAPGYTTNLWGGSHGFSYHHIVTDAAGESVSDTCMQLDEDGNPDSTPGVPGWNHHRRWSGAGGYNQLSSYNNTSWTLQALPGIK